MIVSPGKSVTARERRSSTQRPVFQFRLRNGSSIGPIALQRVWENASGTADVSVARALRRVGNQKLDHVYSLIGPATLFDLAAIEAKLRHLLQNAMPGVHIELTRLL